MLGIALAVVLGVLGIGWQVYAAKSGYNYALMMALGGAVLFAVAAFIFVIGFWRACHGDYDITANAFACTPHNAHTHGTH